MHESFLNKTYMGDFIRYFHYSIKEKERKSEVVKTFIDNLDTPSKFYRVVGKDFSDTFRSYYGTRFFTLPQIPYFNIIVDELNKKLGNKIDVLSVQKYNKDVSVVLYSLGFTPEINLFFFRFLQLLIPNNIKDKFNSLDGLIEIYNKKLRQDDRKKFLITRLDFDFISIINNQKLIAYLFNSGRLGYTCSVREIVSRLRNYKKLITEYVITDGKKYFYTYSMFGNIRTCETFLHASKFRNEDQANFMLLNAQNKEDKFDNFYIKKIVEEF